ncbi:hypothetical protein G6F62_000945 [Rhizopus arrhizus]|nr:hypothetical protein G6F62_000945 [Rhizopus arrhizus]KAG1383206.1 hypothetical protein G6F61_001566 [Rhizopus arrhizus]KAG1406838.1 hypothetical protein G6F60_002639 [Rhizopus arrhizus]
MFRLFSHLWSVLALFIALASFNKVEAKKHNDTSITLGWIMDHMGSSTNYPSYKFRHTVKDDITKEYDLEQIQMIIRHGTRYPVSGDVEAIHDSIAKLKESKAHLPWLKAVHDYNMYYEGLLNSRGQMEHYLMGQRLAIRYPEFIKNLTYEGIISPQFTAYSSWSTRTSQSGHSFCMGAFKGQGHLGSDHAMGVPLLSYQENNDTLIAFHKACPKWKKYGKSITKEKTEFVHDKYLKPIASRLSGNLGLNISTDDVENFYSACQAEVSLYQKANTFCQLLTKEDVLNLEYIEDLKHYYKYSYGIPELNEDMACDLGKDLIENMNNTNDVKLNLKFGHTETLLPFRTLLGLYNDTLSSSSTESEIEHRSFKLSKFGFYANNLMFQVLKHKSTKEKFVRVMENEEVILFPGCKQKVCPIDQFYAYMKPRISCDFTKNCSL